MAAAKTGSHQGRFVNERQLFHGTSPENVEAICKQNFDWRLHGKNATAYGQGSYFALNSSYSDSYAKKDTTGSKFMFVAKVLVGSYTTGQSSYRRPPSRSLRTQQVICTIRVLMICHVLPFSSFLILISSTRST